MDEDDMLKDTPLQAAAAVRAVRCLDSEVQHVNDDVQLEELHQAARTDETYVMLLEHVRHGFPSHRYDLNNSLLDYWKIRDELYCDGLGVTALGVANCDCDVPCTLIAALGVANWACDVLDMVGRGVADLARDGPIMAEWDVTALGGAGLDRDRMVEGPGMAGWSVAGADATVIPYL
ncbi:hypothetical protein Pcinc_000495 [Petrolisthes cinctipes]|uniref:Uncharacterized protein n=1 Tax=Petrolisthes cinctipes TaxID=88211 RepID=A0AAE1GPP1_PETCI|nr:hypothetical protein Pcinc_000495 [Petrolisthes cinctipes]